MQAILGFLRQAASNGIPLRALGVALVVGPILTIINQFEAIVQLEGLDLGKLALTMLVPYCVATWGAVGTQRHCAGLEKHYQQQLAAAEASASSSERQEAQQELQELAGRVHEIATNVNAASRERLSYVNEIVTNTKASAEASEVMRQTAEDSCAKLRQASEDTASVRDRIQSMATSMDSSATEARQTNDAIEAFRQRFGNIDEMATRIREIADQTNLLALNARIEAARAGTAGRGIEKVAGHMDTLNTESQEGRQQVERIAQAIEAATGAADDAAQRAISQTEEFGNVVQVLERVQEDTQKAIEGSETNMEVGQRIVALTR